jgi:glyoxylase I family protein
MPNKARPRLSLGVRLKAPRMEKVLGFGGFFFRARDPEALAKWYNDLLGVRQTAPDYGHAYWIQERGPTVFEPFPEDTDYFGDPRNRFMLNFRVADLAAMVKQLEAAGVAVEVDPQEYPNGIFARFCDPEGNPVAIWQPKGNELSLPDFSA